MKDNNEIAEVVFNKTLSNCDGSLELFLFKHKELIGELIANDRYDDLIKVVYRQGFLMGMKNGSFIKDHIKDIL